jgi:Mg-chelatase subunit ChlD
MGPSDRYVLVELDAPAATKRPTRPPVNVAFVLDRSGSMAGQKIELAKRAVEVAVDRLLPTDGFAIVVYDDQIDVVVETTAASSEAKAGALARLRGIDARGSTNLSGGWLRGAEQAALHQVAAGVSRVLLLTDGLANQGIVDPAELARHAGELRSRGVQTTTFGVGADFDEALLESMARAGGGHFYFIEEAQQIVDFIASEVGELLEIVARDAAVEVTIPDGAVVECLSGYPHELRGNRFAVLVGDLVAAQGVEIALRVQLPPGPLGASVGILVAACDREGAMAAPAWAPVGVSWQYADEAANDAQPRDRSVDRRVAALYAAAARRDAVRLNRSGDFAAAVDRLRGVARRIDGYAGSDPELQALAAGLRIEEARWAAPAPEMARKVAFAASSYALQSRSPSGRASRRS